MIAGYAHPDYARSLAAYGTPRELRRCGGWLLEREIPGFPYKDAMGCYPLFVCQDWSQLKADLDDLASDLVCVGLVTDPFGDYTLDQLHACFQDRVIPFKEHYVLDLDCDLKKVIRKKTRQSIKYAMKRLHVELCVDPIAHLDEWIRLHRFLIQRHNLHGIHRFSRQSFGLQMRVPGYSLFRAVHEERSEGMLCWFVQGDVAYAHLMGISPLGYELGACYALFWASIEHFVGKVRWWNVTGVPGAHGDNESSLAVFKRKWSSETRMTYFCGRILNRAHYEEVARARGASGDGYFPVYRAGEFR